MIKSPLVTIGIPAYKDTFLREAIKSCISQTYPNIEIVVVDDKSPKNIKSLVEEFSDNRLKYYCNETNIGKEDPAHNWNQCLSKASGEFFCLLCDDDQYAPDFISTMIELSKENPTVYVFRSRVKVIDGTGKTIGLYPSSPQYETAENYMLDLFAGYRRQTISEFIIRTTYLKAEGGYCNLPKAMCSDHLSIIKLAQNGGIVSCIDPLVMFRSSTLNLSGSGQNKKNIFEKIQARDMYTKHIWTMTESTDDEIKELLRKRARKEHNNANVHEISYASVREILYLYKRRKEFQIIKSSFVKGITYKVIRLFI